MNNVECKHNEICVNGNRSEYPKGYYRGIILLYFLSLRLLQLGLL